jgi:Glyoxalase-like domain
MTVRWTAASLDFPSATFERGCSFWQRVTGYSLSPPRGEWGEFATLQPRQGQPFLRVQRTQDEPPGCHLDLHVDDVGSSAQQAVALGAEIAQDRSGFFVMTSPGGLPFCVVGVGEDNSLERPPPGVWPGDHRSLVDQVCLDIPPAAFSREAVFWQSVTGWERRPGSRPEFEYLVRPRGLPLRFLLQRLDDDGGGFCRAHLDLACDDVPTERRRHEGLGAVVLAEPAWTTLSDPTGLRYCITRRDPTTGTLVTG